MSLEARNERAQRDRVSKLEAQVRELIERVQDLEHTLSLITVTPTVCYDDDEDGNYFYYTSPDTKGEA